MKKRIVIDSAHQASIYVYLDTIDTENDKDLVVFVPGLLEKFDSPLFEKATHFFNQNGLTVARIDGPSFYSGNDALESFSIHSQIADLQKVLSHFRLSFNKITIVAHSLGAFVALALKPDVDSLILWDPSSHPREIFASVIHDLDRGGYYDPQLNQTVSSSLVEELSQLPDIEQLARVVSIPVGIISAPRGAEHLAGPYVQNLPLF